MTTSLLVPTTYTYDLSFCSFSGLSASGLIRLRWKYWLGLQSHQGLDWRKVCSQAPFGGGQNSPPGAEISVS